MSIGIKDGQYATLWSVEDKGNYAVVRFSTSRKDKRDDTYKNSTWSFARFVGDAHKKVVGLPEKTKIQIKGGTLDLEPYKDEDGNLQYPKMPHITVFNFELSEGASGGNLDVPPSVEDDDPLPF